jgi:hypothetical protein
MKLLSISAGKVTPLFGNHHPNYKSVASAIRKKAVSNLEIPQAIEIIQPNITLFGMNCYLEKLKNRPL